MNQDMAIKLKRSLIQHEGRSNYPYTDTLGNVTIGIGFNLTNRGIDDDWINTKYDEDVAYFYGQLSKFDWFNKLNSDRQIVLIDMAFVGLKKFLDFGKMIAALDKSDYETAANEMLDSEWARQTKSRAITLANAMRSGIYDI